MFLCVCVYDCVCVFVASPVSIYDSTGSVRTARQKQSMLAADRNGMGPQAGLLVVATGQEDRLGGMDGQAPQLISMALEQDEDRLGPVCSSIISNIYIQGV